MAAAAAIIRPKDVIEEGDTVIIYINFNQTLVLVVERGKVLQTPKYGALRHDYLIGRRYGCRVACTKGYVYALCPTPELWSQNLQHRTQITYTSDVSLIVAGLDLKPGSVVGEAGTGSGSLSHALIRTVAPGGHLYTYEVNKDRYEAAREEFQRHGLSPGLVTISLRDVCRSTNPPSEAEAIGAEGGGFDPNLNGRLDAVFLDLPQPWEALASARRTLKKSDRPSRLCSFSPCMEQVQRMCQEMRARGFVELRVVECVPRHYKVLALDRSNGHVKPPGADHSTETLIHVPFPLEQPTHTGYLTFATLPPQRL